MFEFLNIVLFAVILKLMSSMDDTLWLPKLLHNEPKKHRWFIGLIYILTLVLIVFISYILSLFGNLVFANISDNTNLFALFSSFGLIMFALVYLRNTGDENISLEATNILLSKKLKTAFFVSFTGSIDELLVFTAIMSTNAVDVMPLLIGTAIAGLLVILVSNNIFKIKFITNIANKIPIWIVILFVGLVTFIQTIINWR
ncbi:MAG: hypothetical protein NTZ60_01025 [Campylobacterales bacterium]|nr:hypothetical protein [Campylobacterales bacterium]